MRESIWRAMWLRTRHPRKTISGRLAMWLLPKLAPRMERYVCAALNDPYRTISVIMCEGCSTWIPFRLSQVAGKDKDGNKVRWCELCVADGPPDMD